MKVTHEKLLEYMLKTDFQPILVNFWCGNLGGPKAYILKSGGAVAPLAPMVPPPMPSIANLVKSQVNIKCSSGSVHALSIR